MMDKTAHTINHIVSDPDTMGGQPHVAGRRVTVAHIAIAAQEGWSAERIAQEFDLTLAQVHAALSYYHDHAEEIEQQARAAEAHARLDHVGSKEEYRWLSLDELENAIDNLKMVAHFLKTIPSEVKWKWVVIATHQALYSMAITALVHQVTTTEEREQRVLEKDGRLVGIWTVLERVKDTDWMEKIFPNSTKSLVTTPDEDAAIERLVSEFRNGFEHFEPRGWVIEVSGMPKIIRHALRAIRFLALESDTVVHSSEQKNRIEGVLEDIDLLLDSEES